MVDTDLAVRCFDLHRQAVTQELVCRVFSLRVIPWLLSVEEAVRQFVLAHIQSRFRGLIR